MGILISDPLHGTVVRAKMAHKVFCDLSKNYEFLCIGHFCVALTKRPKNNLKELFTLAHSFRGISHCGGEGTVEHRSSHHGGQE
jgi:hypothetical protein